MHAGADATAEERVAADMAFLTSEFCNGRQIGTVGAAKSAQYLADEFERIGLSPAYGDDYVQGYQAREKDRVLGAVQVLDREGKTVASFASPQDLGVVYYPSIGAKSVRGTLTALPATRDEWQNLKRGSVIVAKNDRDESSNILNPASEFGATAVLLAVPSIAKGPVFGVGANRRSGAMPVCAITEDCYDRLQAHLGEPVEVRVDAQKGQHVSGFNVVGVLGDPDSDPTVVVCAHRDSLGRDGGAFVPIQGGTDNASGTATILEIARILESLPEFSGAAVFASFDGEEIGLTGSKDFAAHYPFNKSNLKLVINLDCVGAAGCDDVEIYVTPGTGPGDSVADAIVESLAVRSFEGRKTQEKYGSDHLSFEEEGFATLSIHSPGTAYRGYLHCPKDTLETVDVSVLAALADAIAKGIVKAVS